MHWYLLLVASPSTVTLFTFTFSSIIPFLILKAQMLPGIVVHVGMYNLTY